MDMENLAVEAMITSVSIAIPVAVRDTAKTQIVFRRPLRYSANA